MKIMILFLNCVLMGKLGFAQQPGHQQIQSDVKLISTLANGYSTIQTYNAVPKGFQFYPKYGLKGVLQTTDNQKYDSAYVFMLDKVHQQLFVQIAQTSKIINIEKNQIKKVRINKDGKDHIFRITGTYLKSNEGDFYKILIDNLSKYSFIKIITTKYTHADNTDFTKMKDGDFRDEFQDNISYFIIKPDLSFNKLSFNEKSIKKAFPQNELVSRYFDLNGYANKDEGYLTSMINYINLNLK